MGCHQAEGGYLSAWAAQELRPDPFSLPARIIHPRPGRHADLEGNGLRMAVVCDDGVTLGDTGARIALRDYQGVSMTVARAPEDPGCIAAMVILDHENCELSVPLFVSHDCDEVAARWQSWARELRLPLLVKGLDGIARSPFATLGALNVGAPAPRRSGAYQLRRRCAMPARRDAMPASRTGAMTRHGGAEIIAWQ